jgi:hypothetical protein
MYEVWMVVGHEWLGQKDSNDTMESKHLGVKLLELTFERTAQL